MPLVILHHLLNVSVQLANKRGFKQKNFMETERASCEVQTGLSVLLQVARISQLTVSRLFTRCAILNISQLYRPPRPVTRIALLYGDECASSEVRTEL
jgi:hypothetical protein